MLYREAGEDGEADKLLLGAVHLQRRPVYRHGPQVPGVGCQVPGDSCSGVTRPPTVWINQMKRIVGLFTWRYENKFSAFLKSFRETTTRKFLLFNLTKSKRKLFQSISM